MSNLKALLVMVLFFSTELAAVALNISVVDSNGRFLQDAIVYIESHNIAAAQSVESSTHPVAIMDQINRQFSPYILAIHQGQRVRFPNSDSIKHHVYSFSPAKVFELQLYESNNTQLMQFNNSGVVELGCNIHDWMIGYIFVSPSPWFAQTDPDGKALLHLPAIDFSALSGNKENKNEKDISVRVWHPALHIEDMKHSYKVSLMGSQTGNKQFSIRLSHPLSPQYNSQSELDDEFAEYE